MKPQYNKYLGNFYRLKSKGEILNYGDWVIIFSIERGSKEPLYAGYCYEKEVWEYFTESQLV